MICFQNVASQGNMCSCVWISAKWWRAPSSISVSYGTSRRKTISRLFCLLASHLNEAVLVFCTGGYVFILTPCLTVRLGWGTHPQWLPAFSRIGFFRQHFRLICRWTIYLLRCDALSLPHPIPALPCHVIPDPPGRFMPVLLCRPSVMRGKLRSLSPSAEWTWTPCRSLSGSSFPRVHHAFHQTLQRLYHCIWAVLFPCFVYTSFLRRLRFLRAEMHSLAQSSV